MRRLIVPAIMACLFVLAFATPRAHADSQGFDFSSTPGVLGGTLQYNGSSNGVLNGIRVPINTIGFGSADVATVGGLTCGSASCGWLQFSTGSIISSSPTSMSFNGGGSISLLGTLPGQSGAATTLVSAVFVGPVNVTQISGSTWEMTANVSVTNASSALQALFPQLTLPTSGDVSTLVIVFHLRPNGTFSGTTENTSVFVSTAPEPSSMMLLGSGLIGVGWFLRRRKKVAA